MKLKFHFLDIVEDIKKKDDNFDISLGIYGKVSDGDLKSKTVLIKSSFQPYCYVCVDNVDTTKLEKEFSDFKCKIRLGEGKILSWKKEKKVLRGKEKNFWKLMLNHNDVGYHLIRELHKKGLIFYEVDLSLTQSFIRDNKLSPMSLFEAEGEFNGETFIASEIKPVKTTTTKEDKFIDDLKILAVDIETYNKERSINMVKNPILMIALYGEDQGRKFERILTWKNFDSKNKKIEFLASEAEMLHRFNELVNNFGPDILTGYFSDAFDLPYIKERAKKYKIKLNFSLDNSDLKCTKGRHFSNSKARINGITHIDVFKFVRNIFGKNWKIDSFSLDNVANEMLGEKKTEVNLDSLADDWDNLVEEKLDLFAKYNLQDSYLTHKLCAKLMPSMIEFSRLLDIPLYDMIRLKFSRLVEAYLIKHEHQFNIINPNKPSDKDISQRMGISVEGAFVYEPTPGIYKDVVIFDFLSLYPTIIISHNICGESKAEVSKKLDQKEIKRLEKDGFVKVPGRDLWFNSKKNSFIPLVIESIIDKRVKLKKEIKKKSKSGQDTKVLESKLYSLKVLANSFYGYLGFYGARWYSKDSARAITAYARDYIKTVITKSEDAGFKVIYSDTDSVMIALGKKTKKQAHNFVDDINSNLPGAMELEFEGFFPRAIFVAGKHSDKGAKKKYALIDENKKVKIIGFETVRRNWSKMAKVTQRNFLEYVLKDEIDIGLNYLRKVIKKVRSGKMPSEDLIIKMQLTRPLESYKSIGPHVAVAMRMKKAGFPIQEGMLIEFVVESGKGLIREKAKRIDELKNGYDVDYYLNNQLIPAVSTILHVLGLQEDDLFKKSSQKGLGSFV